MESVILLALLLIWAVNAYFNARAKRRAEIAEQAHKIADLQHADQYLRKDIDAVNRRVNYLFNKLIPEEDQPTSC